jgi:hypothetical protein
MTDGCNNQWQTMLVAESGYPEKLYYTQMGMLYLRGLKSDNILEELLFP